MIPMNCLHAVVLAGLLAGCAAPPPSAAGGNATDGSPDAPSWVSDPYQHRSVRRPYELAGVGFAPGRPTRATDPARLRALEAIASQLEAQVRSSIELDSRSLTGSNGAEWSESLTENIRVSAEADLPGTEVVETWHDRRADLTYVLVSVDRSHLLDRLLPGVEESNATAAKLLGSQADPEADPARALTTAMTAYGAVAATYGDALKAKVVADGSPDAARTQAAADRATELKNRAAERLATLSSAIVIRKLGGDGQHGVVRGGLPQALEARFTYRRSDGTEVPVPDLPVRFRAEVEPGPALAASSSTTDADGRIRCKVSDVAATGLSSNRIRVEPDLEQLAPGAAVVVPLGEAFVFSLPTPGQTTVAVAIEARLDGQPLSLDFVAKDAASHLSGRGFEAEVHPEFASLSEGDLRTRAGHRFRYVIRGHADAWLGDREGGAQGLQYVLCKASLEVVDMSGADGFTITSTEAKSGYAPDQVTNPEAGAVRAFRQLGPKLSAALDQKFVALFAPIGDDAR